MLFMIVEKALMRLITIFLILIVQLSHIFASPPNPLELSPQDDDNSKGYECGNFFFNDFEVQEALSLGLASIDKGYQYPQMYRGQLYSESKYEEYLLYPIKNGAQFMPHIKYANTVFFVVLTKNSNEEVDVVAKITTGDYTKCVRRHNSLIEPSHSMPENANGYLCAHEFFTDDIIHQSLALAQTNVEENPKYPSSYVGLLYPENSGYLMWPIVRGKALYKQGQARIGPYFLILNKERQFEDVVVKGFSDNFLRCIRSRKLPKAPVSDPHTELFVPPPKFGYLCGRIFFDVEVLRENAAVLKTKAKNEIQSNYRKKYSGPPYNEQCLIWPLLLDGGLYKKGTKGPYRLVLTTDYKVLDVAIYHRGKYKACERQIQRAKKHHDTSHYHCNGQYISHQQLKIAAEDACVKMKSAAHKFYPARYQGPRFNLDGPYFTYPVIRKGIVRKQSRFAGPHRVVMNLSCEVVGALTTLKTNTNEEVNSGIRRKIVKCHRLDDGPIIPRLSGDNTETIIEY